MVLKVVIFSFETPKRRYQLQFLLAEIFTSFAATSFPCLVADVLS